LHLSAFSIQQGKENHLGAVFSLISELALFEKAPQEVINSLPQFKADFKNKYFDFFVVFNSNKIIIGFALFYFRYSTWKGKCLYLEDFYMQPSYRSQGIGVHLFDAVKEYGLKNQCKLVTWQVLDWNVRAINFYEKNGAVIDKTWYNGKLAL